MITQEQTRHRLLSEELAQHADVEAAMLYGSVARGDCEHYSDIDVLVFCRRAHKLPIYEYLMTRLSYLGSRLSLVIYTEKELQFLNSAKSLFLLHLSREGILLFDKTGHFESLLAGFEPKSTYLDDFDKSIALVDPLGSVVDGSPNQRHRLSYVYSLFRVFGVYLLAERGIFEFSKDRMARQLVFAFPTLADEVHALSALRVLNSKFFSGGPARISELDCPLHDSNLLTQIGAIASLTGKPIVVKHLAYGYAVKEFEAAIDQSRPTLDYRLRMWFLLLVYDGLNLYFRRIGRRAMTDLAERSLNTISSYEYPDAVRAAAKQTVEYLHRYPLKYFLEEKARISAEGARRVLLGLSAEI